MPTRSRTPDPETAFEAPPLLLTLLESRAVLEYRTMRAMGSLLDRLPRGDGHPVLVLPGFTADDDSTAPLRALLRRLGYWTHGWRLGTNLGPTPEVVAGLARRFDEIAESAGRPISIVGWSLGGIYGREAARARPAHVRQVITLGSPIQMVRGDRSASSRVWESVRHRHAPGRERTVRESERPPLQVPASSIYTRTDGIVHWRTCLIERGPTSENIEVHGSHCGLGFNPSVAYAVADRLAQPEGGWRPFRPPLWLRGAFPRPARLRAGS